MSDGSSIHTPEKIKNPFKIKIIQGDQLSLVNSEDESKDDGLSLNSCSKLSKDSLATSSDIDTISVTGGKVNSKSDDDDDFSSK